MIGALKKMDGSEIAAWNGYFGNSACAPGDAVNLGSSNITSNGWPLNQRWMSYLPGINEEFTGNK